jgi:hypothetical protein
MKLFRRMALAAVAAMALAVPATASAQVADSYTGWTTVSPASGAATAPAWQWNTGTGWYRMNRLSGDRVYVQPFATGWMWSWASNTGWLAMRDTDLAPQAASASGASPIYRLFNNTHHFYTMSQSAEQNALNAGFQLETNGGYAYTTQVSGTVPMYQLFDSANGDYYYTVTPASRDYAEALGYQYGGVLGYVYTSHVAGTTAWVEMLNSITTDHMYTTSQTEANGLAASTEYQIEGVAAYVRTAA